MGSWLDLGSLLCYKDNQMMAFNKPVGLAVQSAQEPTLEGLARGYARRPLHLIHRIDQPASGIVLFARAPLAAAKLSEQFREGTALRIYHAVVSQAPPQLEGELTHFLVQKREGNKSMVGDAGSIGKPSTFFYRFLASSDRYHLLEIKISTGRHHQIRVQLGHAGMPIKGDVKYGAKRKNEDRSIHLHASSLEVVHPVSGELVLIQARWPDESLWNYFREQLRLPQ